MRDRSSSTIERESSGATGAIRRSDWAGTTGRTDRFVRRDDRILHRFVLVFAERAPFGGRGDRRDIRFVELTHRAESPNNSPFKR